jgi:hypothetical protein
MANPHRLDHSASGFFGDNDDISIQLQEIWSNDPPYLGRAVDLGIDLVTTHNPFDQQNHHTDGSTSYFLKS